MTFSKKYILTYRERRQRFYRKLFFYSISIILLIFASFGILDYSNLVKEKVATIYSNITFKMTNMTNGTSKKNYEQKTAFFENYNLTDLYADESVFNEDIVKIKDLSKNFSKSFLKSDIKNSEVFAKMLKEYEKINQIASQLQAYSYLNYAVAVNVEENRSRLATVSKVLSEVQSETLFFDDKIIKLSQAELLDLINENTNVGKYAPFLRKVRKHSGHIMGIQAEKYASEKSIVDSAIVRFYDERLAKITIKHKGKNITLTEALKEFESRDAQTRKAISKKLDKEFEKISDDAFFALKTIIDSKSVDDKYRNFMFPESAMHVANGIDKEIIDNLMHVVTENYNVTSHKYYRLKSDLMKKKKLSLSDRNAKFFKIDTKYSVEESQKLIKSAYSELGSNINDMLEEFFTKPWIDYYNRAGKMGGAFCYPIPSHHPYLMLNHFGSARDLLTFAHEIGHGIHEYSVAKNGALMNSNPLIFAETASVFSEFLIFDLMLKNVQTKEERAALLMQKIEDQLNTIARQTAFFKFEQRIHELAKTKQLTKSDVQNAWMEIQKESLGDSFIFHDEYKNYWVYVSHFFHSPFYVYSYVFGDLFASAMYNIYKDNPETFAPKYKKFLQQTSVANYKEIFKIFNFQVGTQEFWQNSLNYTIKLIEELEFIL